MAAWKGFKQAVADDPGGVVAVLAVTITATPERLALSPDVRDELAWVIEIESVWDPSATNMLSDATGLIQFMPATAKSLGTTVDALRKLDRTEQAPWVQKFFDKVTNKGKWRVNRVGDVYLLVFSPGSLGSDDAKVIYAPGSKGWEQNPGLRDGKTGPITVGSVRRAGTPPSTLPTGQGAKSGNKPGAKSGNKPGAKSGTKPASSSSSFSGWWLLLLAYALRKVL